MVLVCGMCALFDLLDLPTPRSVVAQSDQRSVTPAPPATDENRVPESKHPAKLQKDLSSTPKPKNEEGAEKSDGAKKTMSSLILTVKLALLADPRLFPYEIEVEVAANDVTLSGKVSTETSKAAAEKIAGAVPTVKSVINKLEVHTDLPDVLTRKQDEIITHQVRERFAKSATLTAARFEVKTEQGVVSLGGTVRFQVIVLEAAESARQVPGVKAVKTDKVRIESEG